MGRDLGKHWISKLSVQESSKVVNGKELSLQLGVYSSRGTGMPLEAY